MQTYCPIDNYPKSTKEKYCFVCRDLTEKERSERIEIDEKMFALAKKHLFKNKLKENRMVLYILLGIVGFINGYILGTLFSIIYG